MGLSPGQRVGAYEIVGPLGAGGMGEVYRARDTRLPRQVAIKFVTEELALDRTSTERLAREAELTSSLTHPNIVTVFDVGELDGRPYIVMEFIAGESLHALIGHERLKPARVVEIGAQIADGLAAAHGAGVVHRDLKPRNVMLTEDGRVKIVDFGLGKVPLPAAGADDPTVQARGLTAEHAIVGTAGYMAPEQVTGRSLDFRADQFSLGSILYEMLTGARAFQRDTPVQTMAAIVEDEPPPLAEAAPDAPIELATIVDRCLSKIPGERYASTLDLARDLRDIQKGMVSGRSASFARRPPPRQRRYGWIAAVAVIALAVAAGVMWLNRPDALELSRPLLDRYDKAENVDRALEILEPAAANDPSNYSLQTALAEAYWRKFGISKDKALIDRAAEAASASLKVNSNYAPTHVVLAMLNSGQTRYDGARGEAQRAIDLEPDNARAWRELGNAYVGLRRAGDAEEAFQKATQLGPSDWTTHNHLGGFYLGTGRPAEAADAFQKVLDLAPDNTKAYTNRGSAFLLLEQFDKAAEMYDRSLTLDRNANALTNLGTAYYQQGNYADAARAYEAAAQLPGAGYQLFANLGSARYWAPGMRDQARVAYESAIRLGEEERQVKPKDVGLLTSLADAHAVLARLADGEGAKTHTMQAIGLLASIEAMKPVQPGVLFTIASIHEELGHRAQALDWLGRAVKAGYPRRRIDRSPWLKDLRADPAYARQFPQN